MPNNMPRPSILLIDDMNEQLVSLKTELAKLLPEDQVEIRCWQPTAADKKPRQVFDRMIDDSTILVATDYDLTGQGYTGLFGHTIVSWCQDLAIPVGDFSRGNTNALPKEPNLFELRVPANDTEGARFIASAFKGFLTIRTEIEDRPDLLGSNFGPATILAHLLGKPYLDNQFSLYMTRLGSANMELVQRARTPEAQAGPQVTKAKLLAYTLGHVLLNAILKFPGPILSSQALCAYCGTTEKKESAALHSLFEEASYTGPFAESANYYWRGDVEAFIDMHGEAIADQKFDDFGDYNRAVCEAKLGRPLAIHECCREGCSGKKGGFLCPFTHRTVCQRADCSVAASSWTPQGAELSRVERDFYDEWAPLLGL